MNSKVGFTLNALLLAMLLLASYAVATHAQNGGSTTQPASRKAGAVQPGAGSLSVTGGGTSGRVARWTGQTPTSSVLGDSIIFESKFGLVGIGTDTPTSKLTVQGMIETTMGGYKFPDGTVQTTSASGAIFSVVHDATLKGAGTAGMPLGVAIPLELSGSVGTPNAISKAILKISNTADNGSGIEVSAGSGATVLGGGVGALIRGGSGTGNANGGVGISTTGGSSDTSFAGPGIVAAGGGSTSNSGGIGVIAIGGESILGASGIGVQGVGGGSIFTQGSGGTGLFGLGGTGYGAGNHAGDGVAGILATGLGGAENGRGGYFVGNVEVVGTLDVIGSKNFKIDHPLDPENKYLYHAAIESSEVLNIYSGNVTTDGQGFAVITLPDWFEAVNRDFRYQLTSIGVPSQGLYIAEKINNGQFKIAGGQPGMEVSWQVTGARSDAAMRKHPFKLEEKKPLSERGTYLSPEAFDQPEERGSAWARYPQTMQQLKQQRLEAEQTRKQKAVDR